MQVGQQRDRARQLLEYTLERTLERTLEQTLSLFLKHNVHEGVAFVDIHLAERRIHDIRKSARFHARLRHQIFQFKSRNIDETNRRQMAYQFELIRGFCAARHQPLVGSLRLQWFTYISLGIDRDKSYIDLTLRILSCRLEDETHVYFCEKMVPLS